MFDSKKPVTVRTVRKGKDNKWYVYRKSIFGIWRLNSHAFQHQTSAWAYLGKLAAKEQTEEIE